MPDAVRENLQAEAALKAQPRQRRSRSSQRAYCAGARANGCFLAEICVYRPSKRPVRCGSVATSAPIALAVTAFGAVLVASHLSVRSPAREARAGGFQSYGPRLTGPEVTRRRGTEFNAIRQMHLYSHALQ